MREGKGKMVYQNGKTNEGNWEKDEKINAFLNLFK